MRWNAIVDAGGTPPGLKDASRDPEASARVIQEIAGKHGCDAEVWWDRYSWFAYVTLTENRREADPRAALEELEAENVQPQFSTAEKKTRPWAAEDHSKSESK